MSKKKKDKKQDKDGPEYVGGQEPGTRPATTAAQDQEAERAGNAEDPESDD